MIPLSVIESCNDEYDTSPTPGLRGAKHIDDSSDYDPGGGHLPTHPTTTSGFVQQTSGYKRLSSAGVKCYITYYVLPTVMCLYSVIAPYR